MIAIIGMAALFPQARDLREYWSNIVARRDCISDVPATHWDPALYYDPDPATPDRTYSRRGGFLPPVDFDPAAFGIPPHALEAIDASQLLALVVARQALDDAGYGPDRAFDHERAGVILGVCGTLKSSRPLAARLQDPVWEQVLASCGVPEPERRAIIARLKLAYPAWQENSFPGLLGNVVAGRIASRLDLGGTNCVVDAACASSLGALRMAADELATRRCDMMIAGGVDTDNDPFIYLCFSKTPAFSPSGAIRPFDERSDGMLVGEGLGMVVLKRLEDAQRDGDRVYATIRGIGSSSDGRSKSIYAPREEGQVRALRRAYAEAGVPPASVGLIECHGTGTLAGDACEVAALRQVFDVGQLGEQAVAIGSVKSQIGHTKAAAGIAGLIKAALALHHKLLPPTINVDRPSPRLGLDGSALYVNSEPRPWLRGLQQGPRRAGVSAFGFGGTNFHAVLEEHEPEHRRAYRLHPTTQPIVIAAPTPRQLLERCAELLGELGSEAAEACHRRLAHKTAPPARGDARVGFVSDGPEQTREQLALAAEQLRARQGAEAWQLPQGVYYRGRGLELEGRVVALFPGQGAQYPQMGRELALNFPPVRAALAAMDAACAQAGCAPISRAIFPPPSADGAAEALRRTELAQPAIGAISAAMFRLLGEAGFRPDATAGHSFGELTALWAAGALDDEAFCRLAVARGQALAPPADPSADPGALVAVSGDPLRLAEEVGLLVGVRVANHNAPSQVVLGGPTAAVRAAQRALAERGYTATLLPVAAAFHTPLVAHAQRPFAQALAATTFHAPRVPVYTNTTGRRYQGDPQALRQTLAQHMLSPVLFAQQIEQIYADGGYLFVECGPGGVLSGLVGAILGARPHLAVAVNRDRRKDSDTQLRDAWVQLVVAGLPLDPLDRFADTRTPAAAEHSPLTIALDGSGYVSPATRKAYAGALAKGHQAATDRSSPMPQEPAADYHNGRHGPASPADGATPRPAALDSRLEAMQMHQGAVSAVHGQFLAAQLEHARLVVQIQQQALLMWSEARSGPPALIDGLARSLARMQEQQAESARLHAQYLASQAEYARLAFGAAAGSAPQVAPAPDPAAPATNFEALIANVVAPTSHQTAPTSHQTAPTSHQTAPTLTVAGPIPNVAAPTSSHTAPTLTAAGPIPSVAAPTSSHAESLTSLAAPAPATPPAAGADIGATLLQIVSEKTGYPVAMLKPGMDLESDLGIDSIKRVEILAALAAIPDLAAAVGAMRPDDFGELRTFDQIAAHLVRQAAPTRVHAGERSHGVGDDRPATTDDHRAAAFWSSNTPMPAPRTGDDIQRYEVQLTRLPPPDRVEVQPPLGHLCLLTDEGTPLTGLLVQMLAQRGWRTAVLRWPREVARAQAAIPPMVPVAELSELSETGLREALAALTQQYGPVGAVIHVSPIEAQPALFSSSEQAIVQGVFLLAKHLKASLQGAAAYGRAAFITASRLDGAFGLGGSGGYGAVGGGLGGLTKTLRLEWEGVFCRAIDLSPALEPTAAAQAVLAELYDPDRRIAEVGYSERGRVTLTTLDTAPGGGAR